MISPFGVEHGVVSKSAHLEAVAASGKAAKAAFGRRGTMESYARARAAHTANIRAAHEAGHSISEIRAAGGHGTFSSEFEIRRDLGLPQSSKHRPIQQKLF